MKILIFLMLIVISLILISGCISPPVCGNGICEIGETLENCPIDGGGDCPATQLCGDGVCNLENGENESNCFEDCRPKDFCGDGICNGKENSENCLGDCPVIIESHSICMNNSCVQVSGPGKNECSSNQDCSTGPICGDGICNGKETSTSCSSDCVIDLTKCKELVQGVNNTSELRLNLVFIGRDYDPLYLTSTLDSIVDWNGTREGLFSIEPFKSNKNKFNLWVVTDNNISEEENLYLLPEKYCSVSNWFGYVFINESGRSSAGFGPNSITTLYDQLNPGNSATLIHETGHLIGHLHDEYISGRQEEPMRYYHNTVALGTNLFYDPSLDGDNLITLSECRQNASWKDWIGKGCGEENVVDCIDKYVFHVAYALWDKHPLDPLSTQLTWVPLEDQFCNYGNELNCFIQLNGTLINPFNPGDEFISVVLDTNGLYRQEMFSRDILCKTGHGGEYGTPGSGECLDEIDCFAGGQYVHYNVYRPTFQSRMRNGPNFGLFNEYLIQQKLNYYLEIE